MFRVCMLVCFQFDDLQSFERAFTNLLWIVFNTHIVSNCCLECSMTSLALSPERGQESLIILGFIFRPQTRNIQ